MKGCGANNSAWWLVTNPKGSIVDYTIDEVMGFLAALKNSPSNYVGPRPQTAMKGIGDGPAIVGLGVDEVLIASSGQAWGMALASNS